MPAPDPIFGMLWETPGKTFDLSSRGLIMGVLNVTPDSFSDGGRHANTAAAVAHAEVLISEGADIIDIGGESTRPGSVPVSATEELARVLPVVKALAGKSVLSIDTSKAAVANAALQCGATIVNDISALRGDPEMADVVRESGAGLVLMHMRGTPATMQLQPEYTDVTGEVHNFFRQRLEACLELGIPQARIVLDPGIGFGKTVEHNLTLLKNLQRFAALARPLLVGVSRKSFLGKILGSDAMADRAWPTIALTSLARERGARIFRVHEAAANRQALTMTEAMLSA